MCPTRRVPYVSHSLDTRTDSEEPHRKETDWLSFIQQWRPPAAQISSIPATRQSSSTTPNPPPAPSAPEQPTRSISRLTPGKGKASRELLDTIEPRAVWAKDTRGIIIAQDPEEALLTKKNKLDYSKHVMVTAKVLVCQETTETYFQTILLVNT